MKRALTIAVLLVVACAVAAVLVNATLLVPRRATQVRQGIDALWLGIDAYARDYGGRYPPAAPVRPPRPDSPNAHERRSLAAYIPGWPLSPFSGQLTKAGRQPGDFLYVRGRGGRSVTLTGFGLGGETVIALQSRQ
jgi:hypothetical protein